MDLSGFAAGQEGSGNKRHGVVDTWGVVLPATVPPANLQARAGGSALLTALAERCPLLAKLFAAGASHGPQVREGVAQVRLQLATALSPRREQVKGFLAWPRRGIVARTLAWLTRTRRWAKEFENRLRSAGAFVHLASIHLLVRKLCNPS